jgi:hypothetical protein
MPEVFANNAQSNLNGSINSSTTSVAVNNAAAFPSTGNFRILVDSEIMLVTSVSTNTFTVVRAQEGTTGAAHTSGAICTHVLTAGAMQTFSYDTGWNALSSLYQNSWADLSGGYELGGYMLDRTGRLWLRGVVKPGTTTAGTTIFTLPSGYRFNPNTGSTTIIMLEDPISGTVKQFTAVSNGQFNYTTGGSLNYVSLNGVSFTTLG